MNLFILSEFGPDFVQHVGWSVSYGLEKTLTEILNPVFLYPQKNHPLQPLRQWGIEQERLRSFEHRFNRIFKSWFHLPELPTLPAGKNILLAIGLTPDFLFSLHALGPVLKQFDLRIAYLLDGFDPEWLHPCVASHLDHVFIISSELAREVHQVRGVETSFLPLAANVTQSTPFGANRWIDILNYGRTNTSVHKCLQDYYNQQTNNRMYFHSTFSYGEVYNHEEHVMLMQKLLNRSKISLCFEASKTPRFRKHSPLLYRWFEAWSAGCTIVGKRPLGEGVTELMSWENSTIELPDSPADWIPFFEALLEDEETLILNSQRNYRECVLRHDWRYRIRDMFMAVDLPIPEALKCSIADLQEQGNSSGFFKPAKLAAPVTRIR